MGDFDRLREASRDRLLERPRTRAVMAPKKDCSVGLGYDLGEAGEHGGDIWPDDCESTVFVRTGGMGWKVGREAMIGDEDCMKLR
jgi:hypothetical protein